jgi:hypothetical protein
MASAHAPEFENDFAEKIKRNRPAVLPCPAMAILLSVLFVAPVLLAQAAARRECRRVVFVNVYDGDSPTTHRTRIMAHVVAALVAARRTGLLRVRVRQ